MFDALGTLHDLNLTLKMGPGQQDELTREMMAKFPQMEEEFTKRGLVFVMGHTSAPHALLSRKPVTSLADLRGLRVRTYGVGIPKLFAAVGAVPVDLTGPQVYSAMQTGALDAAYSIPDFFQGAKLNEVSKYLILLGAHGNTPFFSIAIGGATVTSTRLWNSLSPNDRELVKRQARDTEVWLEQQTLDFQSQAIKKLEAGGVKVSQLSDADIAQWHAQLPDLYREAANSLNAKGLPGTKFVDTLRELAEKKIATETYH